MTPEEIELLRELTIVIPTNNRPLELERAIEYWRDTPITVHILDGSDQAFFAEGLQPGTTSICYHSFPSKEETATENAGRRLKFGVGVMSTRFSALCCDDDVFTFECLVEALNLLESGAFEAIIGKTGEYIVNNGQVSWVHKYSKWRDEDYRKSENMFERVVRDDGVHAFYGIY